MNAPNTNNAIRKALASIDDGAFHETGTALLDAMGYRSQLTLPGQTGKPRDFISEFPADNPGTQSEQDLLDVARSIRILFQYTDSEIEAATQPSLFDPASFYTGNARSFMFVAVELEDESYPRGQYTRFTRELNKRIQAPVVALFRTPANRVTLAFVHRRPNKLDSTRDVLGRVSLIREIETADPHRAHLDVLAELSLSERLRWMDDHGKPHNFDGLLDAWLDALDTEELNRRFYHDLFGWFQTAVETARFPANTIPDEEHIIRLITRLLFVWFIKEKGLVADELFIENRVRQLLKDYDSDNGDSYYRAVLQNLFFATLNTEIGERRFSRQNNADHRNFSVYRYRNEMADPDALLQLFDRTPFINGGLFDCLDSFDSTGAGGVRIDCFTDNPNHRRNYSISNRLFFGSDGLITLFNRYKFTVEENTPADTEVALDPELLGKVFENLLAAFNPETRESVRKQTGSYYTPRAVVDYMVDEALVASLAEKAVPDDGDADWLQERLRYLLDYTDGKDALDFFEEEERKEIINAIAELRVLDPAVGSGAFPMGMLHKLTLALRRLDPDNVIWEELQKKLARNRASVAFDTPDQAERDEELQEISATFQRYRDSDFGRKLYLIQNSIYGVDIQPVATQIAKLRFFISLAIEQQPTQEANDNYGIKPLPNLETRFVAANTLLTLERATQIPLGGQNKLTELNDQLRQNRERHFNAGNRSEKLRLRKEDTRLRDILAKELRRAGMSVSDSNKLAQWDPYNQNATADWFDAEYMFGVARGFDVVIGNPPYVQLQKNGGELRRLYQNCGYETIASRGDVYQLFYEKGCQLLASQQGILAYITSNSWLKAEYGKSTRLYFSEQHTPFQLLDMGKDVFESAIVDASILLLREGRANNTPPTFPSVDMDRLNIKDFPPAEDLWVLTRLNGDEPWSILSEVEWDVVDKMTGKGTPLKSWDVAMHYGVKTGLNDAFIIDNDTRATLVAADPKSAEIIKPMLRGRDIQRYQSSWAGLWLIIAKFGSYRTLPGQYPAVYKHLKQYETKLRARGQCRYTRSRGNNPNSDYDGQHHWLELDNNPKDDYLVKFTKEKLFWIELTESGRFSYDDSGIFGEATTFMMVGESLKYLCAVMNSTLVCWIFQQLAPTSGMGTSRWKKVYIENIPIPKIAAAEQRPFIRLVDQILEAKAADPDADTSELEESIDWLVYDLYDLTDEETAIIADYFWDGDMTQEEEDSALVKWIQEGITGEYLSREVIMETLRNPNGD